MINIFKNNYIFIFKIITFINYLSKMACGCKKNAAVAPKAAPVVKSNPLVVQESLPEKKNTINKTNGRIIKREIR